MSTTPSQPPGPSPDHPRHSDAAAGALASWRQAGHRATVSSVYRLERMAGQEHHSEASLFLTRPAYMRATTRATIRSTLATLTAAGLLHTHPVSPGLRRRTRLVSYPPGLTAPKDVTPARQLSRSLVRAGERAAGPWHLVGLTRPWAGQPGAQLGVGRAKSAAPTGRRARPVPAVGDPCRPGGGGPVGE